tara:strand:- start:1682 stop:2914 length:1233 start_codon:yes stop_codon:yes gene_type:complete
MSIVNTVRGNSHEEIINIIAGNYITFLYGVASMNTYYIKGETGVGKTAITRLIAAEVHKRIMADPYLYAKYPELSAPMPYKLIDGASADVADFSIPVVNHDGGYVEFYGNKSLGLHTHEPIVINIDELTKMPPPVMAATHTALSTDDRMLGHIPLHPLTLVILTGNLTEERLGDTLKGHTANRIVPIKLRKPSVQEYVEYAAGAGYNHYVIGWVYKTPELLDSFTDPDYDPLQNSKIWNPKNGGAVQCFTCRSSEKLSNIAYAYLGFHDDNGNQVKGMMSKSEALSAMQGAVGNDAAADFMAFLSYRDKMPEPEDIKADWKTAKITDDPIAHCIVVTQALGWCKTAQDCDAFLNYCTRLVNKRGNVNEEAVNMFISKGREKLGDTIFDSEKFRDWCLDKSYINSKHVPKV